jgi:hypothetical protein
MLRRARVRLGRMLKLADLRPCRWNLLRQPYSAIYQATLRRDEQSQGNRARGTQAGGNSVMKTAPVMKDIWSILDELEAKGVIVKNGKMRPDSNGVLRPVYVLMCHYDRATPKQLETYCREMKALGLHGSFH